MSRYAASYGSASRRAGDLCLDSHQHSGECNLPPGLRSNLPKTSRSFSRSSQKFVLRQRQNDAQTSLTLDPAVIASGFSDDGQSPSVDGQTQSLTSSNNFINYCALFNLPLTNGLQQQRNASCNPVPMGVLPSVDLMPSSKFRFPLNGDTLRANVGFTISMKINNLNTGVFTDASVNYLSAPQQLDDDGQILGHSAIVLEELDSLTQTTTTTPGIFAFFKGLQIPSQVGVVSADIETGLPVGVYRLSSITSTANHQPVLLPTLAHGAVDDVIYFTVTSDGKPSQDMGSAGNPVDAPESNFVVDLTSTGKISQQSSITLDPSAVGNFTNPGSKDIDNLTPSLISTNNFINFCLQHPTLPLTNGKPGSYASCNPAPMGLLVPSPSIPSVKFQYPRHMDNVPANSTFTVRLRVSNLQTGVMTNPDKTYLSAPQQINKNGQVLGHAHIVIEQLSELTQDEPTNPKQFAFFAELGQRSENGVLTKDVTGLPDGVYRLSATSVAANHQPVLPAVAQHGSSNDMVYFTVGNGGNGSTSANTLSPDVVTITSTAATNTAISSGVSSSSNVNIGAAVGGAIGGVIALALLIGLLVLLRRRRVQSGRRFLVDEPMTTNPGILASQVTPYSVSMPASTEALVHQTHAQLTLAPVQDQRGKTKKPVQSSPQSANDSSKGTDSSFHHESLTDTGSPTGLVSSMSSSQLVAHYWRTRRHTVISERSAAPSYHTHA